MKIKSWMPLLLLLSDRVKTQHKCLRMVLLVFLLAGVTSATTVSPAATNPQKSVFYFVQVTVDITGQRKTEAEVTSWLQDVLQTNLQICGSPVDENTSVAPTFDTITATKPESSSKLAPAQTLKHTTAQNRGAATTNKKQTAVTTRSQASTKEKQTAVTTRGQASTNKKQTAVTTRSQASTKEKQTAVTTRSQASTKEKQTTKDRATTNKKQTIQTTAQAKTRQQQTTVETRTTESGVSTVAGILADSPGNSNNGVPNNRRERRDIRWERDTSIQTRNSPGIFQDIEVSCAEKTSIRDTECTVTLRLSQQVPPCCILQAFCAASQASSKIHVVGTRANILNVPTDVCSVDYLEDKVCTYEGKTGASCDLSSSAYGPPQCTPVKTNCTCQGYCDQPVAFYTIKISMQPPETVLSVLSVISRLQTVCAPTNSLCQWSTVSDKYQNATAHCDGTASNPQQCRLIIRFAGSVPICTLSEALVSLFQTEDDMALDGEVNRAVVCVNSEDSSDLSNSQLDWFVTAVTHERFCSLMQGSFPFSNVHCDSQTTAAVLQLDEQCDVEASTTSSPNVTTTQTYNVTTVQANSTTPNTTAESLNATTVPANVTGSTPTPALSKEGQANALLELTKDVSKLNSTQVSLLISALEKLLAGPNVSLALGNISVQIISNLQDASLEAVAESASRMRGITDTVGLKLVLAGESETLRSSSVALSVKRADAANFQETYFSISDPSNVQIRGHVRDSSIAQASVTLPSTLTQNLTSEEQLLVSRVQFNFYQKNTTFQDASLGKRKMNSGIVSASVTNMSIAGLQHDVIIRLRNIEAIPVNYESLCVFWDQRLNDGSGGWNQNGCYVRNTTDNETVCGCNHLTSFAILLNLSRLPVTSRLQATILTFITYIGCGVSAIFLAFTLLTYLSFGKLRKDIPSKILIQLCLSLLLLNLVFLVDAWLALYVDAVGLCISTAWFLHYFLLVVFTWMGLEAVHMYLALVKVFNTYISHYMVKFSLVGWGVPMLVVIIVIAIDKDNYGLVSYGKFDDGTSDSFCWIRNDIAFYVAVVAYFCVIFVFNFIMFLVVLVQLCRIKRQNPHNLQHRTTLQDIRSVTGITVLLGLTWGFAFFAWGPVNLPFMYLFAIFNSLQGFFIFVFHCLVKDNVRRQWRTYLCCGKMRLAENSEWSRTATQKTGPPRSSVTRGTSLPSSKTSQSNNSSSSSSFLVTDNNPSSGIGSPLDDTAITADERYNADVILNETNSQNRTQPTS